MGDEELDESNNDLRRTEKRPISFKERDKAVSFADFGVGDPNKDEPKLEERKDNNQINTNDKLDSIDQNDMKVPRINIGNFDEVSEKPNEEKEDGTKKSTFAKQANNRPPPQMSFSNSIIPQSENENKYKNNPQPESEDDLSSSSESSVESDGDYMPTPKPDPVKFRRKSKSNIFDINDVRYKSMLAANQQSRLKSTNNLLSIMKPPQQSKSVAKLKSKVSKISNTRNPEVYKEFVSQLKSVAYNQEELLDQKSQRLIKTIIKLENSWVFHF